MPARGKSLTRFVQLRRLTEASPGAPGSCKGAIEAIPRALDFSDAWSDAVRDVIAQRDRRGAIALYRAKQDALTPIRGSAAQLALLVLGRSMLNERLTIGDVREVVHQWTAREGLTGDEAHRAMWETTTWAVDVAVLGRLLRPNDGAAAMAEPLKILRGMAILRLAGSSAGDSCLVRLLLRDRSIKLPTRPRTDSGYLPAPSGTVPVNPGQVMQQLASLRRDLVRMQTRAAALSRTADPTIAEVREAAWPDLCGATKQLQHAAERFGLPESTRLSRLSAVLELEYTTLRSAAMEGGTARLLDPIDGDLLDDMIDHDGGVIWVPPTVPVMDAEARVLGRGDLMILRSEHLRYELNDISHIENVLASEVRGRLHVIDTSTSDTVVQSSQSLSESTQELETTEHNSLERAAEEANTTSSTLSLGVSVSGGFGPVKAGIEIGASQTNTTSASNSSAVSYAKDVTERATELLRASESWKRTTTTKTRVTETNEHKFDNAAGTANIAGIYRWVVKVDQAQMFNYGERLLLEFIVPKPATQLVAIRSTAESATIPVPPAAFNIEAEDLSTDNYIDKGAKWSVLGLEPPPPFERFVAWTMVDPAANQFDHPEDSKVTQPEWGYTSYANVIPVPDGYAASVAYVSVSWAVSNYLGMTFPGAPEQDVEVVVAGRKVIIIDTNRDESHRLDLDVVRAGPVPVTVSSDQKWGAAVSVRVLCERTVEAFDAWQLATYETIRRAYLDQQAAYDSAIRVQQSRQTYAVTTAPDTNRLIEALELKRGCQTILTGQDFDLFGALTFPAGDIPRINRVQSIPEGEVIQLFEDCFEWENGTYLFYPYHWAGRPRWAELLARFSTDTLHQAFLQAGAARVVVPVREGYERAVGSYLATSVVPVWHPAPWRGGQSPYPPIDDLIADANDRPGDEVAIGEPWEVVTPTSLVYLQVGSELNPVITATPSAGARVHPDTPRKALHTGADASAGSS